MKPLRKIVLATLAIPLMLQLSCQKEIEDNTSSPANRSEAKDRLYWTYTKDDAFKKFEQLSLEYDCLRMNISHPGFPNSSTVLFEIYSGHRNEEGDCVFE